MRATLLLCCCYYCLCCYCCCRRPTRASASSQSYSRHLFDDIGLEKSIQFKFDTIEWLNNRFHVVGSALARVNFGEFTYATLLCGTFLPNPSPDN